MVITYQCTLLWYDHVNVPTLCIWNITKEKLIMQFLLSYDDDYYVRDTPFDLNYVLTIMDHLNAF